jgi:hypothetical protein
LRKIIDEPSGAPQILHKAPEYKHYRELQEFYFGIWVFPLSSELFVLCYNRHMNERDKILRFLRSHKKYFQQQFAIVKIALFGLCARGDMILNKLLPIEEPIDPLVRQC